MSDQPLQFCHRDGLTIRTEGDTEVFHDAETGLRVRGYGTAGSVFPPAHTLVIEETGSGPTGQSCVAFDWEKQFYPEEIPEGWEVRPPPISDAKKTWATGGTRRGYISENMAEVLASNGMPWRGAYWNEGG